MCRRRRELVEWLFWGVGTTAGAVPLSTTVTQPKAKGLKWIVPNDMYHVTYTILFICSNNLFSRSNKVSLSLSVLDNHSNAVMHAT